MNPRTPTLILLISLALNVFLVGCFAGAYFWYKSDGTTFAEHRRGIRFAADTLSPSQRKAFRQALAQTRRDAQDLIDQTRASRVEVARLLQEEAVNEPAIEAELNKARTADMALRTRIEQTVIAFAQTLSPDDRKTLVEDLRHRAMLRQPPPSKNN